MRSAAVLVRETVGVAAVGAAVAVLLWTVRGAPVVERDGAVTCADPSAPAAEPAPVAPRWISVEDAAAISRGPAVTFVDARSRTEFATGHVTGALSVPEGHELSAATLDALRATGTIIAYCDTSGGCARSSRLANVLVARGLEDVRILEGGLPAWIAHDQPAEAGPCRDCPSP